VGALIGEHIPYGIEYTFIERISQERDKPVWLVGIMQGKHTLSAKMDIEAEAPGKGIFPKRYRGQ
jgi:hypothetical protein